MTRGVVLITALACAALAVVPDAPSAAPGAPSVRKDVRDLSAGERRQFVRAVKRLKRVPSPYSGGRYSYYDQFVAWHLDLYRCGFGSAAEPEMRGHGGPMFLAWHRAFVLRFEKALREVSGRPIAVPYWDWTDASSTRAVFSSDFMGGDGDPAHGFAVRSGPFREGAWELVVHPKGGQWAASATPYLTRRFGSIPTVAQLPSAAEVDAALNRTSYDVDPFDSSSDPAHSFRSALEGWRGNVPVMHCGPDGFMATPNCGCKLHNAVHAWVGGMTGATRSGAQVFGTMVQPTSPNDPVFFLHHSNIDRLWWRWQRRHGVHGTYRPLHGVAANSARDELEPFGKTPDDVADITRLGYVYDDDAQATRTQPGRVCRLRRSGRR